MTMLARITFLSAAIVGALIGAPNASASPESDFCRSMSGAGFTGDCATITALARDVCTQYDRGADLTTVLQKLDLSTKNENLSNYIVAGAQLYFCPERTATS
ncbi:hypothetical protein A5765_20690 [Mycolicibacterium celeriflavum]|uniref:DUF732 domain-containing protein n=1 Tax=Mycolicibacterium celeriflavum TaxID=1249101 RepID=UPI0007FC2DFF|nr:DUF732 domain-containing protein [Mycolicibacterium celeriflavum]OBG22223.1 hypothetical protein A5765_20690 [Mycolicibacterium celeriflavum]